MFCETMKRRWVKTCGAIPRLRSASENGQADAARRIIDAGKREVIQHRPQAPVPGQQPPLPRLNGGAAHADNPCDARLGSGKTSRVPCVPAPWMTRVLMAPRSEGPVRDRK